MCIDYTDLNKAYPKDPFGLPRIDQVVDSTARCKLLCILDAYSGYHQVSLNDSNYVTMAFITPFGAYYYITMPFGLKNVGATYQRAMQRCLHDQLGCNMEAYIPGQGGSHIRPIREVCKPKMLQVEVEP